MLSRLTPHRLWIGLFAIWFVLLSGSLKFWKSSPPGALQAFGLHSLKTSRGEQLSQIEKQIERLQADAIRLTQNRVAQEREVRKVLGYAGEDELLFDFSTGSKIGEQNLEPGSDSGNSGYEDEVRTSIAAPVKTPSRR